MVELTKRQEEILKFVMAFSGEKGYPPSIREIGSHFRFGTRAAKEHLDLIEKKGFIKRGRGARMIEVSPSFRKVFEEIPLVGKVAAGLPVLAEENLEGYLKIDSSIAKGKDVFFLTVRGESMSDSGIREGDLVLVLKQKTARSGDIVVARISDEATVKEFSREKNKIRLVPHNRKYPSLEIHLDDDFEILGKVIGLWRNV